MKLLAPIAAQIGFQHEKIDQDCGFCGIFLKICFPSWGCHVKKIEIEFIYRQGDFVSVLPRGSGVTQINSTLLFPKKIYFWIGKWWQMENRTQTTVLKISFNESAKIASVPKYGLGSVSVRACYIKSSSWDIMRQFDSHSMPTNSLG